MSENSYCKTTQHLVTLAREGDKAALENLCQVYAERVHWIVRFRMGTEIRSKLDSMDVVQDAFVLALQDLEDFTYKDEGDFLRWLSGIVENRIRDNVKMLHADKRDIRKEISPANHRPNSADSSEVMREPIAATTPSMIVSRQEDWAALARALDTLKPEYSEAIVLTKIEGLSYREIARRLGKSDEAVRKLVARGMSILTGVFEGN